MLYRTTILRLFAVVWSKSTFRPKKELRTDKIDQRCDGFFFFVVQSEDLDQKIIDQWCKNLDLGLNRLKIDQGLNF